MSDFEPPAVLWLTAYGNTTSALSTQDRYRKIPGDSIPQSRQKFCDIKQKGEVI